MAVKGTTKRGFLPGYLEGLQQKEAKERYAEKLKDIAGQDPYEIPRNEWIDDVDSWPDVTYIYVGMCFRVFHEFSKVITSEISLTSFAV